MGAMYFYGIKAGGLRSPGSLRKLLNDFADLIDRQLSGILILPHLNGGRTHSRILAQIRVRLQTHVLELDGGLRPMLLYDLGQFSQTRNVLIIIDCHLVSKSPA